MAKSCEAVQELEELGFNTVWIPEAVGREPFAHAGILLSATKKLIVGTGIASMYARTASTMQAGQKTLTSAFPDRFLLGIGASHGNMVKSLHKTAYVKPYSTMVEYLDVMDGGMFMAAAPTTPLHRVLAALGPKMLKLAGERADGAHPYFTTPKHTAVAREILGSGPTLAPEQAVILETDPTKARAIARAFVASVSKMTACSGASVGLLPKISRATAVCFGVVKYGCAPSARSPANFNIFGPRAANTRCNGVVGSAATNIPLSITSRYSTIAEYGFT